MTTPFWDDKYYDIRDYRYDDSFISIAGMRALAPVNFQDMIDDEAVASDEENEPVKKFKFVFKSSKLQSMNLCIVI